MKRISCLFLILIMLFSLTACSASSVRLATEFEIKRYVRNNFGDATYLRQEKSEDKNSIIYYFRDEQFGFEYYVGTYVSNVGMDGSTFWYHESKSDNFHSQYCKSIVEEANCEQLPDGVYFELCKYSADTLFAYVNIKDDVNLNQAIQSIAELSSRLTTLDTRRILKGQKIILRDLDNNWLGKYKIYEKEYVPETLATFEYYNSRVESIMGVSGISINGCKTMLYTDVPGLANENIANILGADYTNVTCYYFSIGNTKYFVTDACVMYGTAPKQYIYNISENRSMVSDFTQ